MVWSLFYEKYRTGTTVVLTYAPPDRRRPHEPLDPNGLSHMGQRGFEMIKEEVKKKGVYGWEHFKPIMP